jgi:hypothetical protein
MTSISLCNVDANAVADVADISPSCGTPAHASQNEAELAAGLFTVVDGVGGGFTDGGAVGDGLGGAGAVVVVDVLVGVDGASEAFWMLSAVLFAGLAVKSGRALLHDTPAHASSPMNATHLVLRMPIASATSLAYLKISLTNFDFSPRYGG